MECPPPKASPEVIRDIERRLKADEALEKEYLRVNNEGYLEMRLYVGMTRSEWCDKIAERLLKTPLNSGACALLTGESCAVFVHSEKKGG